MSAWIPSKPHIDLMVSELLQREVITPGEQARVGKLLAVEVVRSVAARYVNDERIGTLPGDLWALEAGLVEDERADAAELLQDGGVVVSEVEFFWDDPEVRLSAIETLALAGCYRYQACEHNDWHESEAAKLCEELEKAAILAWPGRLPSDVARYPGEPLRGAKDRMRETPEWHAAPWGFEAEHIAERKAVTA